jgi:hypothetical protein
MEKSNEVFNVPKCPSCGKSHKYNVAVLRSSFLFGASATDVPVEKHVRRLFTCPKYGAIFEGIVTLRDDPVNKIASVTVEGLIEEEK